MMMMISTQKYVLPCRYNSERMSLSSSEIRAPDIAAGSQYSGYLYQHKAMTHATSKLRRFCVLRYTTFLCYKSDTDFRSLLCLPVDHSGYDVIYRCGSEHTGTKRVTHVLEFSMPASATYLFSADTEALARRWLQVDTVHKLSNIKLRRI